MRYMVIEKYVHGPGPVDAGVAERVRMLPSGLAYLESWIDPRELDRCFQLMEAEPGALERVDVELARSRRIRGRPGHRLI